MATRINYDQKETALEVIRAKGTIKAGAEAADVTYQTIRNEMKRSSIFKRRVEQALADGKGEIGDDALSRLKWLATEENKDTRSRLTANIALLNWILPGFRGSSKVEGKIQHDVKVITGVPRPNYLTEPKTSIKIEDKEKLNLLNAGKPITKPRTVEEAIEGEVIDEM